MKKGSKLFKTGAINLSATSSGVWPDEKGIETNDLLFDIRVLYPVLEYDLMKKGSKRYEFIFCSYKFMFWSMTWWKRDRNFWVPPLNSILFLVLEYDLMKKGSKHCQYSQVIHFQYRSGVWPDEKGIETYFLFNLYIFISRSSGVWPDEKGIETLQSSVSYPLFLLRSGVWPDEKGIETGNPDTWRTIIESRSGVWPDEKGIETIPFLWMSLFLVCSGVWPDEKGIETSQNTHHTHNNLLFWSMTWWKRDRNHLLSIIKYYHILKFWSMTWWKRDRNSALSSTSG